MGLTIDVFLQALCGEKGRAQRTRAKAIGALSCLSTYPVARSYLIAVGVVEEALIPTLQQKKKIFGDGDEYKAMRADAVSLFIFTLMVKSLDIERLNAMNTPECHLTGDRDGEFGWARRKFGCCKGAGWTENCCEVFTIWP